MLDDIIKTWESSQHILLAILFLSALDRLQKSETVSEYAGKGRT